MDTRTGRIYTSDEVDQLLCERTDQEARELMQHLKKMKVAPTELQMQRIPPKVGRNEPCPCGSGKKFKKCCLGKEVEDQ